MKGKVSMRDIAERLGVSVKTVSGALNGDAIRMSNETRRRIRALAEELGYSPNFAARGMRQGVLPVIGLVADGVATLPFATEIIRSLDNAARMSGLAVVTFNVSAMRSVRDAVAEAQNFLPRAIVYATSHHRTVTLDGDARASVGLLINCRDDTDSLPAIVPDDRAAARAIVAHCLAKGRQRVAFLNLPGLLAGQLREEGFRDAHTEAGLAPRDAWILPATRGARYSEFAASLVNGQIDTLMDASPRPDTILCGNDRIALEVYGALRRRGIRIPEDVAVVSFDNQAEIARRLDPPLTTMALPYREMGRRAAEIAAGNRPVGERLQKIPFRLIERASV